jgi:hypothetical protein
MSETNIPSEIKEKIEEKYPESKAIFEISNQSVILLERQAAEYGYQLASKTIDEKDEEIARLKENNSRTIVRDEVIRTLEQQASTIAALEAENKLLEEREVLWANKKKQLEDEIERLKAKPFIWFIVPPGQKFKWKDSLGGFNSIIEIENREQRSMNVIIEMVTTKDI